jgi:hypothetical protein
MSEIFTFTLEGCTIRTWRKDVAAAHLAHWIYVKGPGMTLSDLAQDYAENAMSIGAAYLRLERALPFEVDGMVFIAMTQRGHKIVSAVAGKLESVSPKLVERDPVSRPRLSQLVDETVDKRLKELEGWVNVFALREEAFRYMEGVEKRLEARIAALEESENA